MPKSANLAFTSLEVHSLSEASSNSGLLKRFLSCKCSCEVFYVQSDVASHCCGSFRVEQHSLFFMFDLRA